MGSSSTGYGGGLSPPFFCTTDMAVLNPTIHIAMFAFSRPAVGGTNTPGANSEGLLAAERSKCFKLNAI